MTPTIPKGSNRERNPYATQRNLIEPVSGSSPTRVFAGNAKPGVALGFWVLG